MRLYEIQDDSHIAAARTILTNVEYAVTPKRLLEAYNVLMADPELRYTGEMYRLLTLEEVWGMESAKELDRYVKRQIPRLLKPRSKGLLSFTNSPSGFKALFRSLSSSGMISSPIGIIAKQSSVGLDVNKVCGRYFEGSRFAEECEVLSFPVIPMVLDKLFAESMDIILDPSEYDKWLATAFYEVGI